MKGRSPTFTQLPLDIVGSTKFGRYPKISQEATWNMIISDGFLVDAAGYAQVAPIITQAQGRAIFTSVRWGRMIVVIGNGVYSVTSSLAVNLLGNLNTYEGDVWIDENNVGQIGICDGQAIWIYNWLPVGVGPTPAGTFAMAGETGPGTPLNFIPGYLSFQNGRFITVLSGTNGWALSKDGDGTTWPNDSFHRGFLNTKPDNAVAAQRFPGRGNLLYVMGMTVSEPWQDVGGAPLFPYQRNSSVNIDYGCLNPATIAFNENMIAWLAGNEKSGPFIAFSTGGDINKISTDGIDYKLSQLTKPQDSYGFFFRQDGHLIYQITFPTDNITYIYDFNTKKFFNLSDQNQNFHIAKRVAFFNDTYYFVSFIDGNLYEYSTKYTTFDGLEIPRIRICRNVRMPDASRFAINNLTFTIEQGTQPYEYPPGVTPAPVPQTVALSISKDGGQSFGNYWRKQLNNTGLYRNRLIFWNLGAANDFVPQLRFYGLARIVCTDGILSVYQ